ncbi:GNAT family N-acetyltransferase [Actinoplanes sp. NPDC023714]|uniref:GNAT family N-acetyltransferase n=1 Tax=Actinoplanes sp. NPDC023714 TaxID=3154322 RepID=UPI003405DA41
MTIEQVEFRELKLIDELEEMVHLLCRVWKADSAVDLINASTLWALAEAENYVTGLYVNDVMVAAAVAIRGRSHLHSHIVGVHPDHQGSGFGYELKQHEALWAKAEGLDRIRWTFDPLVRRNAHFNLAKLHARVLSYENDLYNSLNDGLNDDDETDRLFIEWEFAAPEITAIPDVSSLSIKPDDWDFEASPGALHFLGDGVHCLVPTPSNIEKLRQDDPKRARDWRFGVRAGFRTALVEHEVAGFSPFGWYVLRRR